MTPSNPALNPRYDIVIRQGDLYIELSSDDVYFISKQMDKWFQVLMDDSYIPASRFSVPVPVVQSGPPTVATIFPAADISVMPQAYAPAPVQPFVQELLPPSSIEPLPPVVVEAPPVLQVVPPVVETPVALQPEPLPQPLAPVLSAAVDLAQPVPQHFPQLPEVPVAVTAITDVLETLAQPAVAELPVGTPVVPPPQVATPATVAPESISDLSQPIQDDFEKVMDSLMEDLSDTGMVVGHSASISSPLESFSGEAPETQVSASIGSVAVLEPTVSHSPLGTVIEQATTSKLQHVRSLKELCDLVQAVLPEEFLLLSAYYLAKFEQVEKFSLKRINSAIVQAGLSPVNHSILETGLSKGLLHMVPDMTGMADVAEYAITEQGSGLVESLF